MAKVCIDAGHYAKYNRCPNNANYYESKVMWKLHLLQKKYLEQLGIEVVVTRTEQEKDLALTTRGKKAKGCDLFISNHSNAVGNGMNENVDYAAIYHLTDDTTTKADDISKEFANKIAPVIANVMGTKQGYKVLTRKESYDRNGDGIMNDNYYGVLHGARLVNVAGLILEHSFHTNSKTVEWLLNDDNLDKLARAEAECIASYLLKKTVTLSTTNTTNNASTAPKFEVGDIVMYNGSAHYTSANATTAKACKGGKAKVTGYSEGAKHPYQLIRVSGGGATVYGWVDEKYISAIGVTAPTTTATTAASVYYPKYTGKSIYLDIILKEIGVENKFIGNWSKRKPLAIANGISNYEGTTTQNSALKALAKQGKLKKV